MQDTFSEISGGQAKLVSNMLGRTDIGYQQNGCASLLAYTNGYQIRGFALQDRPIIAKPKDILEGLDAHFCIGMGYELDNSNNWVCRVEQFEYFYRDALIMTFDNVSDYKEPIDTELIYNQLSFGFSKYTQDLESVSTLDEFLTQHEYNSPVESYKGKLAKVCKQIGSGYAIELTRRKPYSADTNGSWTYDEDNFIIAIVPDDQGGYKPERLENFTASGIISPDTAYNIRLSITRMLARWARWINSGLAYKTNAAIIKNTYVSKNGDLISKYTGNAACESKVEYTESNNLLKGDLAGGTQAFFPDEISFTTKLTWEKIREIRRCFVNKDPNGRNNGYFGVIDPNGVTQYGFLKSLEYNPVEESVKIILRKKYIDLNQPFDCSDYSDWTFEMFESATGLPKKLSNATSVTLCKILDSARKKILSSDTLESGFRSKYNETVDEIITSYSFEQSGFVLRLKRSGGTYLDLNLQEFYYSKTQISQLLQNLVSSPYLGQWNNGDANAGRYKTNIVVDYNGRFWRANSLTTVLDVPGVSNKWVDVLQPILPLWSNAVIYAKDSTVRKNVAGSFYQFVSRGNNNTSEPSLTPGIIPWTAAGNYAGNWINGAYLINQTVSRGGHLYNSLSANNTDPLTNADNWKDLGVDRGLFDPAYVGGYAIDDAVRSASGLCYESNLANNAYELNAASTMNWDVIGSNPVTAASTVPIPAGTAKSENGDYIEINYAPFATKGNYPTKWIELIISPTETQEYQVQMTNVWINGALSIIRIYAGFDDTGHTVDNLQLILK